MAIIIGKVAEPFGWLGNMSPYPIACNDLLFKTSEALFQALRYADIKIIEEIRQQKSPMSAKMVAKKYKSSMIVEPSSEEDLGNMRLCLRLKLEQHPSLVDLLLATDDFIVEDCTKRQRGSGLFWGGRIKK